MNARDYLEHLRAKPEHVRKGIALGVSVGITALVAVGYFAVLISSGALALNTSSQSAPLPLLSQEGALNELLGAAGAFRTNTEEGRAVEIVETDSSTTLQETETGEGRTVIPF